AVCCDDPGAGKLPAGSRPRDATRSSYSPVSCTSLEGVNERRRRGVDSSPVTAHANDRADLLGGGLLSDRLRSVQEGYVPLPEEPVERPAGGDIELGKATQLEIDGADVQFLVPFRGSWPNEYWLRAFRQANDSWPSHLVEPRLDEGRGL